jgi:iron complex outermembrane receptor protein
MPLAQDPLGLTRAQLTGDPTQAGNNSIGKFTRKVVLQNQLGSSAQTAIDADNALTARAYYGTRENLQYQASTTWVGLNRTYYGTGLQYNGRTQWQGIPLELAAGYEFDKSSERRQGGESVQGEKKSGSPTPLTRDEDNEAQNNDFFVQATAHVSEQISIVGGIRRSNIAFNSSDKFLSDTKDGSGSASFSATSPVLGITWHANNNLNLYVNYGKGFESPTLAEMAYSGTTAPVALFNPLLNASSSQHYEIGAKWVPLRDARVDLAVYQIDSSDEIVTAASASGQTSFKNAPGTARTGWELAAASHLSEHLSARLSASSIDAKYSQTFKSATTTIASGNKIPGIPDSSTFAEIAWTSEAFTNKTKAPLGSRVALEWQQAGRIFANDLNTESADGRNVFNVSLSQRWAWNQGLVTAYGRINNVSDVRYVGSVIVNQAASQFYEPAMPQNWMLGLSLSMPLR